MSYAQVEELEREIDEERGINLEAREGETGLVESQEEDNGGEMAEVQS
jgi:hypothetical protein